MKTKRGEKRKGWGTLATRNIVERGDEKKKIRGRR